MTDKELAELIFPNITKTPEDYEKIYPERKLESGAAVSRFAPSPTGFVHMGSLLTTVIERKIPDETNGVFYLRIEDTDQKRSVENGIKGIVDDLKNFEIKIDEGALGEDEEIGDYGPYIQSKRKEIYECYAKDLISKGLAYPCFCTPEELDETRNLQELNKERIGYYGSFAKCRNLSNEERAERIKNGEPYIIRLKSPGNYENKVMFNDLVRGKIVFPENDLDVVLIKSDGLPIYHFAHAIDDHLMRTTHVLRGEEWLSSVPVHIQLFKILGFELPQYAHLGLVMKIDEETGAKRKLSKRKDKEAAVSFYHEQGIPVEAVKLYLMTIGNSNFEEWLNQNPDASINDFKFNFKKMSASGSLFDLEKLINISRNYISRLKAQEVYERALKHSKEFDTEFYELLTKYKDYCVNMFNIEREQKKPRKDYAMFSEIKGYTWYMFDELFTGDINYEFQSINDLEEIKNILKVYLEKYYNEEDDEQTWFERLKDLSEELGYAREVKEYKENPDNYKGHVGDISMVLRVALSSKSMTPNLYQIMKLFGRERLTNRFNLVINK
ncbi:MAG: glutamate--tRNA ligase [Bacilli bacterium]|nr:glutamate--tRNA ligase [Bacilli bacterium]